MDPTTRTKIELKTSNYNIVIEDEEKNIEGKEDDKKFQEIKTISLNSLTYQSIVNSTHLSSSYNVIQDEKFTIEDEIVKDDNSIISNEITKKPVRKTFTRRKNSVPSETPLDSILEEKKSFQNTKEQKAQKKRRHYSDGNIALKQPDFGIGSYREPKNSYRTSFKISGEKPEFTLKAKSTPQKKMTNSNSEDNIAKSKKEEAAIAMKCMSDLAITLKSIKKEETVIFDRDSDKFIVKNNPDDIEITKCIRRILSKIKLLADYEIEDLGYDVDTDLLGGIIEKLEKAQWAEKSIGQNLEVQQAENEVQKKLIEVKQQINELKLIKEERIAKNKKKEVEIAMQCMSTLEITLKSLHKKESVVFDRESDKFIIKRNAKDLEITDCVKKILTKIKLIADYELGDLECEVDAGSLGGIIEQLKKTHWGEKSVTQNFKVQKDANELQQKLIESKTETPSTYLTNILFGNFFEKAGPFDKVTLDDISLFFPIIMTLPAVLKKVLDYLIQFRLHKDQIKTSYDLEQLEKLLIGFCKKCIEADLDLQSYINSFDDIKTMVFNICGFASADMKDKINDVLRKTASYAINLSELNEWQIASEAENSLKQSPVEESLKIQEFSKQNFIINQGVYSYYRKNDQNIFSKTTQKDLIIKFAESITSRTSHWFLKVPLDEMVKGELGSKEKSPHYNRYVSYLNALPYIAAADILLQDAYDREKAAYMYINTIKELINFGDYASALALKATFDLFCFNKITWKKEIKKQLEKWNVLFEPSGNFRNLKIEMNNCKKQFIIEPPQIFGREVEYFFNRSKKTDRLVQGEMRLFSRKILRPFQIMKENLESKLIITDVDVDKCLRGMIRNVLNSDELDELTKKVGSNK